MRLVVVWACASCSLLPTTKNPAYCEATSDCADGFICDVAGNLGAAMHTCIQSVGPPCADGGVCPDGVTLCGGPAECPTDHPVCASPPATCELCTLESHCAGRAATPHCGPTGACVECRSSGDCAGNRPVCEDATCRACRLDSECPSLVCDDETGACVAESAVAYVDMTAQAAGSFCAKSAPCKKVNDALKVLAVDRTWVRIAAGSYAEEGLHVGSGNIQLKGVPGMTVLQPANINAPVLLVDGTAAVRLIDLTLRDASGTGSNGITCSGSDTRPNLGLRRVLVTMNRLAGVDATNCNVSIVRSTFTANDGGGLNFTRSSFNVRNSFIVRNGTKDKAGIAIAAIDPGGPDQTRLVFNTIARNGTIDSEHPTGVMCLTSAPLMFSNNIVWDNGPGEQVSNCAFTFSDIGPTTATPQTGGNINVDPTFVDGQNNNFHLTGVSKCIDAADPAATEREDFDGEARPARGRSDMGADEVP